MSSTQLIVLNSLVIFSDYFCFLFAVQSYLVIDHSDSDGVMSLANKVISLEICLLHFLNSNIYSNRLHLTLISSSHIGFALSEVPSYGGCTAQSVDKSLETH